MPIGARGLQGLLWKRWYHKRHTAEVPRILPRIQAETGRLDARLVRQCTDYAGDVLGWRGYAPWLYVYTAMAGEFREGWIPENYYGFVVVPHIKGAYGSVSLLKPLAGLLLGGAAIPDIAYSINGYFYKPDFEPIRAKELQRYLFTDHKRIVFKADHSSRGKNISVFDRDTFCPGRLPALGNGVFQGYIAQHELFESLMPDSVATLRMTTVIDKSGMPSLRSCHLRLGREGDTYVKSARHIRIAIDPNTGAFSSRGYLTDWSTIDRHPDSGVEFSGLEIPAFSKCVDIVLALQRKVPYSPCVGWDLAVDRNNNVVLMEWNGTHNGIKFPEAIQGPCFSDLGWEKLWHRSS